jgi:hypothetical protein
LLIALTGLLFADNYLTVCGLEALELAVFGLNNLFLHDLGLVIIE